MWKSGIKDDWYVTYIMKFRNTIVCFFLLLRSDYFNNFQAIVEASPSHGDFHIAIYDKRISILS
jgi:hypothetical protein